MLALRFTRLAESDLNDILDFITEDAPLVAQQFVRVLRERCGLIASQPETGRLRSEFTGGVRSFPFGDFVVFYRVQNDSVDLLCVLRGARDLDALLK